MTSPTKANAPAAGVNCGLFELAEDPPAAVLLGNPVRGFASFAARAGLAIPGAIVPDGERHRFHVEGDGRGTKNGWYALHVDGVPAGVVGTWKEAPDYHKWCSREVSSLTPSERQQWQRRIAEAKARQAEERAQAEVAARRVAAETLESAGPENGHPYLSTKGVTGDGLGLRVTSDNTLLVPVCDVDGTLHSLQRIYPNGDKRFLPDGVIRGRFFVIGGPLEDGGNAHVCEGLSTGLSVHAATGGPAVVAFNAGNLRPVCEAIRNKHRNLRLAVAGDNDRHGEQNTGLIKGRDAAEAVGAGLVVPEFGDDDGTDWNDLHQSEGIEEVRRQLGVDGEWVRDPIKAAKAGDPVECTDTGNARRFAFHNQHDVRFDTTSGKWVVWDGRRWSSDATGEVLRRAIKVARGVLREAAAAPAPSRKDDPDLRQKLSQWGFASEGRAKLSAMVSLAQAMPGISLPISAFDADPWLLTCLNGTIDLRTGELRPHSRADLVTKLAPVEYDPDVRLALWDRFLTESTDNDMDLATFLQRAVGYSLTGDTREEKLFFVHGPNATGKTTFVEAVKAALGDYATTLDFESLVKRRSSGGPRDDIARLAGARLVAGCEVDEGKALAEGLVKMITGGDTIVARHLYRESFEFAPSFKLWLAANHAPKVSATDGAMWRRILRIPFEHVVPREKRDPALKATLRDPSVGGKAVLAWAVQGCLEWQRHGLGVPASVDLATEAYREDCDPLRDFFVDCVVFDANARVPTGDLRRVYEDWCGEQGIKYPLSARAFADRLRDHGCEPYNRGSWGGRGWSGVGLAGASSTEPTTLHNGTQPQGGNSSEREPHREDFQPKGCKPLSNVVLSTDSGASDVVEEVIKL